MYFCIVLRNYRIFHFLTPSLGFEGCVAIREDRVIMFIFRRIFDFAHSVFFISFRVFFSVFVVVVGGGGCGAGGVVLSMNPFFLLSPPTYVRRPALYI